MFGRSEAAPGHSQAGDLHRRQSADAGLFGRPVTRQLRTGAKYRIVRSLAIVRRVSVVVLVPGYGGRLRAVERWRMAVALRTLATHGGGTLVVSGHQGEAQRLALLAPQHEVVVEPTARTTWDNVERSIPYFEEAFQLAVASDWFHARRASQYLRQLRPDLSTRLVPAERQWWRGWWIQAGGAVYETLLATRRLARSTR